MLCGHTLKILRCCDKSKMEIFTQRCLNLLDLALCVHQVNFYTWHQASAYNDYQKRLNIPENEYHLLTEAFIFYLKRVSEINFEDNVRVFLKVQTCCMQRIQMEHFL